MLSRLKSLANISVSFTTPRVVSPSTASPLKKLNVGFYIGYAEYLLIFLSMSTDKLCKVKRVQLGHKGVPYLVTHDGRTIRYPDPAIRVNDTIRLTLPTKITSEEKPKAVGVAPHGVAPSPKIDGFVHFEVGNLVSCTGGRNMGRVGTVVSKERHLGGFDIVHVRDAMDKEFSTRISNVFVIGEGNKAWISLPKQKGIKLSITEGRRLIRLDPMNIF